jgi:hypothetical protein
MSDQKTLGENRVRTEFNPSKNGTVDQIKQKTAELINLVEELWPQRSDVTDLDLVEIRRLKNVAQDNYEQAAMWAVKAATT